MEKERRHKTSATTGKVRVKAAMQIMLLIKKAMAHSSTRKSPPKFNRNIV